MPNEPSRGDDQPTKLADQCLAYLLGEMPPNECAEFEQRLSDADVARTLERESGLLVRLAEAEPPSPAPPRQTPSKAPVNLVGWLIAIAAGVLLLCNLNWQTEPTPREAAIGSMELQIAQTWADSPTLVSSSTLTSEDLGIDEFAWISSENEPGDEPEELTDSLDWMVAAVEAEVDVFEDGQNDG